MPDCSRERLEELLTAYAEQVRLVALTEEGTAALSVRQIGEKILNDYAPARPPLVVPVREVFIVTRDIRQFNRHVAELRSPGNTTICPYWIPSPKAARNAAVGRVIDWADVIELSAVPTGIQQIRQTLLMAGRHPITLPKGFRFVGDPLKFTLIKP